MEGARPLPLHRDYSFQHESTRRGGESIAPGAARFSPDQLLDYGTRSRAADSAADTRSASRGGRESAVWRRRSLQPREHETVAGMGGRKSIVALGRRFSSSG